MGGRRDASTPGPALPGRWLVLGLLLAALATAAVFLVEPLLWRVGLLAVCWGFLIAALLAGRRRADQVAAAAREAELRHAYELELEREVAARHEYEVQLESRLRQETEDAVRGEVAQLRAELAGLPELRADLAALAELRTEIAALAEIRGELAGLGALRDDLARMRTELTELLSGELLIDRMVMRAQSVRGPADAAEPEIGRTLEGAPSWGVDRWDVTRVVPAVPIEARPRPLAAPPPVPPPFRATASVEEPPPSYDSAAYDDLLFGSAPTVPASEPPSSGSTASVPPTYEPPTYEPPTYEPSRAARQPEPQGHARLEQILAESGVEVPSGGRSRRRRYRDEDDRTAGDDVLARVLGRQIGPRDSAPPSRTSVCPVTQPAESPSR